MGTTTSSPPVSPTRASTTVYRIDPETSRIEFSISKRLFFVKMLTVTGRFMDVAGTLSVDEHDPLTARADVTIGATSIDTGNARRDTHLRKAEFFHADQHPEITFVSRRVEPVNRTTGDYRVVGDLTVRGVTREVTLETHDAPALSAGQDHLTLTLTGPLNRQDFGLAWNSPVMKVADDLTVSLVVSMTRV